MDFIQYLGNIVLGRSLGCSGFRASLFWSTFRCVVLVLWFLGFSFPFFLTLLLLVWCRIVLQWINFLFFGWFLYLFNFFYDFNLLLFLFCCSIWPLRILLLNMRLFWSCLFGLFVIAVLSFRHGLPYLLLVCRSIINHFLNWVLYCILTFTWCLFASFLFVFF